MHPWFYALLALDLWEGRLLGVSHSLAGETLLWLGVFNLVAGYVSAIALGSVAAARRGRVGLAAARRADAGLLARHLVCSLPALLQLVTAPYYWEKTEHTAGMKP